VRAVTRLVVPAALLAFALAAPARADDAPPELVVGVTVGPPGIIHDADGTWRGICVDAWKDVAREIGLAYRFVEVDSKQVIARGPGAVGADVITCVPINPRTEAVMDVTHPFTIGGLGIATRPEASSGVARVARKLLDLQRREHRGVRVSGAEPRGGVAGARGAAAGVRPGRSGVG
jgi:hypothetical protein